MQTTFWQKNNVIIGGLVLAIMTALSPIILGEDTYDWRIIIVAVAQAASAYFGNDKRGKGWTHAGIATATLAAFSTGLANNLDWFKIIFMIASAGAGVAIPNAKPQAYEESGVIQSAKAQAEVIKEAEKTTPPKQV